MNRFELVAAIAKGLMEYISKRKQEDLNHASDRIKADPVGHTLREFGLPHTRKLPEAGTREYSDDTRGDLDR